MFNQSNPNSESVENWRIEREKLVSRLETFCRFNKIVFADSQRSEVQFNVAPGKKYVFALIGDTIMNYEFWKELNNKCKLQEQKFFIITDNFLADNFIDLECIKFHSAPELLGMFAEKENFVFTTTRTKKYNCFINRVESTRQSWFYFLHQHGLLDQGYVSFLLTQLNWYSELTGVELFSYIHKTHNLDQLEHFEKAYQELKNIVPYRNFKQNANLNDLILDSKYSLILETSAPNDFNTDCWSFSEKSFRTLQLPSLPLLFTQINGIKKLESLGLVIGVNHGKFDHLPWQIRQEKLLKILIEDTIDLDETIIYNQAVHNKEIVNNLLLKCQNKNFFDEFFTLVLEQ
jgi:hypothetical protein